jgi:hypothetical protein
MKGNISSEVRTVEAIGVREKHNQYEKPKLSHQSRQEL